MKLKRELIAFALTTTLLSTASVSALAGSESHGGNVVVCEGKDPVLLDYYHASLPTLGGGAPDLINVSGMNPEAVVAFLRSRISGPAFLREIDRALMANGPIATWIATDLRSVDDSAEPYVLPTACKRVTAAIRQGNVMYVDPGVYRSLSPEQQGLLVWHEAIYRASREETSENVRNIMRVLLRADFTGKELVMAVHLVGRYFNYETLYGRYVSPNESWRPKYDFEFKWTELGMIRVEDRKTIFSDEIQLSCSYSEDQCTFPNGCVLMTNDPARLVMTCPDGTATTLTRKN